MSAYFVDWEKVSKDGVKNAWGNIVFNHNYGDSSSIYDAVISVIRENESVRDDDAIRIRAINKL